ncbi:MAG: hypothetical protein JSW28_06430 [Thermoplasmata archaeon]|nr:MAG: hypothetical protein JSW28_06430 [Thermoplasmata archaeon]
MEMSKRYRCTFLASAIVFMLTASLLPSPVSIDILYQVEAGKYGDITPTAFEVQLLDKINENRTADGKGILRFNASLVWVARAHSQDMIDFDWFDHPSPAGSQFGEGTTPKQRANDHADYTNSYIGETIYINSVGITPEGAMSNWMGSQAHKDIILDPAFKEVGIGLLEGEYASDPVVGLHTAIFGGGSTSVDLTVGTSDIAFDPPSPSEGQLVNISVTIHNNGWSDAFPVTVRFYDGDPDSGGTQIGTEQEIPEILIHGEIASAQVQWSTADKGGSHDIYVVVDPGDVVTETNEGNNKAYKSILVSVPIHLEPGRNLVSFPHIVSGTSLASVLSSISGDYDKVESYNASNGGDSWKHYHVSKNSLMNELTDLDNTMGFWVYITEPAGADLAVSGELPSSPQPVQLKKGWNMVGYPSATRRTRTDALSPLTFGVEIDAVEYHDTATDSINPLGAGEDMVPGRGYWIHATQDCTWIVNS